MRYQSRSNSNSRGESIAKRSLRLCVPRTSSALNSWRNRLTSAHYDRAGTIFPVPCGLATQAEVAACSRERGASTSVDRFAAQDARPSLAHEQRSLVLYPDVSLVSIDPAGPHDHPSRDPRALASGRLSLLLALEVALTWRATPN